MGRRSTQSTGVKLAALIVCLVLVGAIAGAGTLLSAPTDLVPEAAPMWQESEIPATNAPFGFGRPATEEEIAAWDIDVRPDGAGLPEGSGSVAEGAELYAALCTECHGATGTEGPYQALVARYDADNWPGAVRAIGNYWPYASTIYDYTYRTMPFNEPKSLTADEVYALTAWLLHQNGIVDEDAVMDAETLPQVEMPALEKWVHHDLRDNYPFR